ncbi:UNVERIFIED_CONTAM: hypothetical protein Slati_4192800 [Sesamum latifolium]|uniref:Endonuclease/exonuclease/phosphatase domain-containing protein n=1 Tax=Sesamum latifolium TaxID=2727402 RepID=A0AAW2TAX6_9LAMI
MFDLSVDSRGKGGGLILLWCKDFNLVVHSFSSSHIDAGIASETGDFNEILSQDEKIGAPRPRRQIEEFRSCLAFCELVDLGCSGHKFTWCNQCEAPKTVRVHLDRVCATLNWQNMFPNAQVSTEATRSSDHNPLVIELEKDPIKAEDCAKRRRLCSKLEEYLSREEILRKQWGKAQWLAKGGRNTPYFHARASARKRKNSISRLRDKNGEWCITHEGIQ